MVISQTVKRKPWGYNVYFYRGSLMQDSKVAVIDAPHQSWRDGCLVISEADAHTIWVFEVDKLQSPVMKSSAMIANDAIAKMVGSA